MFLVFPYALFSLFCPLLDVTFLSLNYFRMLTSIYAPRFTFKSTNFGLDILKLASLCILNMITIMFIINDILLMSNRFSTLFIFILKCFQQPFLHRYIHTNNSVTSLDSS